MDVTINLVSTPHIHHRLKSLHHGGSYQYFGGDPWKGQDTDCRRMSERVVLLEDRKAWSPDGERKQCLPRPCTPGQPVELTSSQTALNHLHDPQYPASTMSTRVRTQEKQIREVRARLNRHTPQSRASAVPAPRPPAMDTGVHSLLNRSPKARSASHYVLPTPQSDRRLQESPSTAERPPQVLDAPRPRTAPPSG